MFIYYHCKHPEFTNLLPDVVEYNAAPISVNAVALHHSK